MQGRVCLKKVYVEKLVIVELESSCKCTSALYQYLIFPINPTQSYLTNFETYILENQSYTLLYYTFFKNIYLSPTTY